MNDKYYYFSISAFIFGIFLSSIWNNWNLIFWIFLIFLNLSIWIFLIYFKKNKPKIKLFLILNLFFAFGISYYQFYFQAKKPEFENLIKEKITRNFIVDDEPEVKGYHTKLILKFKNSNNKSIAWVPNLPKYEYGDELNIDGWLLKIKNFDKKFNYENFLKKENIFYEIKIKNIELIKKHQGNLIKEKLFEFKTKLLKIIKKLMPEPESSLLAGILIGAKENMSKDLLENFRKTGLIHIVVLSGYNLSILASTLMFVLSFLGRKISGILGSSSIILFALMTGASATVVRAAIMALLVILASQIGRKAEALKLLFLAVFLMLLYNPMFLVFDPSFELSFLATLGILILAPKIETFVVKKIKLNFLKIGEILGATLAAQIFVAPLILYMMGDFSLVAPIVNLLILFLIQFSMLIGVITIIFNLISFNFAQIISYTNYLILKYDILIVNYFSQFKYSIFHIENFSATWMFGIYGIYFLIFIWWKFLKDNKKSEKML